MRDRAREAKDAKTRADGEKDILAVIARVPEPERTLCERLHKLIRATAPGLAPKTWTACPPAPIRTAPHARAARP